MLHPSHSEVMQKDIFYDELSVYENLYPTAMLRLPYSWPASEKQRYLKNQIEAFGLTKVEDTRVGTAIKRGLSGGEVKCPSHRLK